MESPSQALQYIESPSQIQPITEPSELGMGRNDSCMNIDIRISIVDSEHALQNTVSVRVIQCTVLTARVIRHFAMNVLLIRCCAVTVWLIQYFAKDSIFHEIICYEIQC